MVHAPLRGLFALTRLALIVGAAAAVPVILKKSKPIAKKVGDALIEFGSKLKEDVASAEKPEVKTPESSDSTESRPKRPASRPAAVKKPKPVKQTKPKPAAASAASAKRKPPKQA